MFIAKMLDLEEFKDDKVIWKKKCKSLEEAKSAINEQVQQYIKEVEENEEFPGQETVTWSNWETGKNYEMTYKDMFNAGEWKKDSKDEDGMIMHYFWTGFDYSEQGVSFIIEE